jgi:hypothetical protein
MTTTTKPVGSCLLLYTSSSVYEFQCVGTTVPPPAEVGGSGSDGAPIGAVAGGVVGGVAVLVGVSLLIAWKLGMIGAGAAKGGAGAVLSSSASSPVGTMSAVVVSTPNPAVTSTFYAKPGAGGGTGALGVRV